MRYLLTILMMITVNASFGQKLFNLNASVPPAYNGSKVYLRIWDYYSTSHQFKTLDSTTVTDNEFTFSGTLYKPCEKAILYMKKDGVERYWLQFVVDTGLNEMEIDRESMDYYQNKMGNTNLLHSTSNRIDIKLDSLYELYYRTYGVADKVNKSIKKLPEKVTLELANAQLNVLRQYPNEYYDLIVLRILTGLHYGNQPALLETFNTLDPELKSTALGMEVGTILNGEIKALATVKTRNQVPEFSVKTERGKVFNNESLNGKPYVIAFSATWCSSCQFYEKKLQSIYHKYKDKDLNVVYFNLDNDAEKWKSHINDKYLDWINVSERTPFGESSIAKQFYTIAIPSYIVVDKTGTIVYNTTEMNDENAYVNFEKSIKKILGD